MKKLGATDVMVRPLDAYYVDQLNADFSKILIQTKKILAVAEGVNKNNRVDRSTQVEHKIWSGLKTREKVQAMNHFFFDPS